MVWIEALKAFFIGIIEGITEWLPISSTGHMLLADEVLKLNSSENFKELFFVVIQLGAILSVVLIFWKRLWPFYSEKKWIKLNNETMSLWFKIAVACIPSAVIGFLFDDYLEEYLMTPIIISIMLIVYGILFILVEKQNKNRTPKCNEVTKIDYKMALIIGAFQVLSLIPGTSRSGATIIGALIIGVSRVAASEFTFFLAIPTMLGASLLKVVKLGFNFTIEEIIVLLVGIVTSFVVSLLTVKMLMGYVKKHDFKPFGIYRIVLGIIVISVSYLVK